MKTSTKIFKGFSANFITLFIELVKTYCPNDVKNTYSNYVAKFVVESSHHGNNEENNTIYPTYIESRKMMTLFSTLGN